MTLAVRNITCSYGKRPVFENISFRVEPGEVLCLLGPNGVGKTTLFKGILGFIQIDSGGVFINDENIKNWSNKKLAKAIGYVPQAHTPPFAFSVWEVVLMGRNAHFGFSAPSQKDEEIAGEALEMLGVSHLRGRIYTEISGGERQMVLIARALAQQPAFLVMDEPTANLDFGNQIRLLQQINKLKAAGLGIIMTSHFPDHAFLCSTKAALLSPCKNLLIGTPDEIVTEENLQKAYGVNILITKGYSPAGAEIKSCVPLL